MSLVHWSKPTERTIPRVNPEVNCELRLITMCQREFTDCNKYTPPVGNADGGGGGHGARMGEQRGATWKLCIFCSIFL